jgi:hypothetical protein
MFPSIQLGTTVVWRIFIGRVKRGSDAGFIQYRMDNITPPPHLSFARLVAHKDVVYSDRVLMDAINCAAVSSTRRRPPPSTAQSPFPFVLTYFF